MGQRGSQKQPITTAPEDDLAQDTTNHTRRHVLVMATAVTGVVGIGLAAWPFIASWQPSARARAMGGPIQVNLKYIEPGQQVTVTWRGQPVWVLRRTPEMLERMTHEYLINDLRDPDSTVESQQPTYAQNSTRSLRPDLFVAVALCTHLGCIPAFRPDVISDTLGANWMGGFYCPCHGSKFDFAGRVTKNVPAPTNLVVPPYRYLGDEILEIGVDNA